MSFKKIIKLAMIRKNEEDSCPFGLSIPLGCKYAGELVDNMAPVDVMGPDSDDAEKQAIMAANNHLFKWKAFGSRCKYADKIISDKDAVECDWGTNTAGESGRAALEGSQWYSKQFNNDYTGMFSYPIGFFNDNSIDRGAYLGMTSVESIAGEEPEDLNKFAEEENKKHER